jgi:hypothetical protein
MISTFFGRRCVDFKKPAKSEESSEEDGSESLERGEECNYDPKKGRFDSIYVREMSGGALSTWFVVPDSLKEGMETFEV